MALSSGTVIIVGGVVVNPSTGFHSVLDRVGVGSRSMSSANFRSQPLESACTVRDTAATNIEHTERHNTQDFGAKSVFRQLSRPPLTAHRSIRENIHVSSTLHAASANIEEPRCGEYFV